MGRRLLVLAGLAVVIGLLLRRRRRPTARLQAPDPADELRRTLDDARRESAEPPVEAAAEMGSAEAATQVSPVEAETAVPPVEASVTEDLDERRRSVHERGRAALEGMRDPAPE